MTERANPAVAEARPAATVVLLRDGPGGVETLMLKRNRALMFAGGVWVFPGGALDPADVAAAGGEMEAAARIAAAREAQEEAGLSPRLDDMVLLSHWTTPEREPKRFATWIYAAPVATDDAVVIDGGEIHAARWLGVAEAAAEHEARRMGMLPPTYMTLRQLSRYSRVADMVAAERDLPVPQVFPVFTRVGECDAVLFRGDAGYDSGDSTRAGSRHRAVLVEGFWEYEYRDVDPAWPPLFGREG